MKAIRSTPTEQNLITVRQGSILTTELQKGAFEFALIHPPYLGVINYHQIHRLATDMLDIVKRTIAPAGLASYDFSYATLKQHDVSTDRTEKYMQFVDNLASVMTRIVAPDGRCAVIIGDQRYKGHLRHPFTDFINHFENNGFVLEENFIWVLQNNGGMHVLRRGHFIDHNYILIFHKPTNKSMWEEMHASANHQAQTANLFSTT
jgi:hypothetical protein